MNERKEVDGCAEMAILGLRSVLSNQAREEIMRGSNPQALMQWFSARAMALPLSVRAISDNSKFVVSPSTGVGLEEVKFRMFEGEDKGKDVLLPDELASPLIWIVSPGMIRDGVMSLVSTVLNAGKAREFSFLDGNLRAGRGGARDASLAPVIPAVQGKGSVLTLSGPDVLVQVLPKSNPGLEERVESEAVSGEVPRGIVIVRRLKGPTGDKGAVRNRVA